MNNDVIDMLWADLYGDWVQFIGMRGCTIDEEDEVYVVRNGVTGNKFVTCFASWTDNDGRAWDDLTDEEQKQWLP